MKYVKVILIWLLLIGGARAAFVSFGVNGSPVDPWASLDGRLNAPTGTPQFATLLNSYGPGGFTPGRYVWPSTAAFNNTTSNFQQPQWHVPAVDYAVGPDAAYGTSIPWKVIGVDLPPMAGNGTTNSGTTTSSAVLHFASVPGFVVQGMAAYDVTTGNTFIGNGSLSTAPTGTTFTLSANAASAVSSGDTISFAIIGGIGTSKITAYAPNSTMNGWDFTQGATPVTSIGDNASNFTLSNCKMKLLADPASPMLNVTASGAVIEYNLFDANGFYDHGSTVIIQDLYTGATSFATGSTYEYNILQYSGSDAFSPNSGGSPTFWITWKYNLVQDMGCELGSHPDWMQLGGSGTQNWNVAFNLFVQRNTTVGSQPWVMATQNLTGAQQGNYNNNLMLALSTATANANCTGTHNLNNMFYADATEVGAGTGLAVSQNYIDPTASSGLWGGGGGTFSGNVRLTNGATTP